MGKSLADTWHGAPDRQVLWISAMLIANLCYVSDMKFYNHQINGHLDILIDNKEDEFEGEIEKWQEVLIHGDPDGLRSLARLLLELADVDQEKMKATQLPIGAREHYHLSPNNNLSKSSVSLIIGRLDAKGTGKFYDMCVQKDKE